MFISLIRNRLLWTAILPPVFLIVYIYKMDKKEKESLSLLIRIFIAGALACVPALILEYIGEYVLRIFSDEQESIYGVLYAYCVVAFSEELFKFIGARRNTWYSFEFNCRFDGILYCVCSSLGFATLENIVYVFNYGIKTGILRAVLAIPGHMMFGVFMGIFYGKAKEHSINGNSPLSGVFTVLSVLTAVFLHGTYDYCLFEQTSSAMVFFVFYVVVSYILTFYLVNRYSKNDYYIFRRI